MTRDGARIAWERHGEGSPTLLLLPSWSLFPSRLWKLQVPWLARRFRVLTFDGRGTGRSDAPDGAAAYADTEFARDATAILDANGVERAIVVGLSMGAGYGTRMAVDHPDRVQALVLIGAALSVLDRPEGSPDERDMAFFEEPVDPEADEGWGRYNAAFWRRAWPDFVDWFVTTRLFAEPHSTKQIEDGISWGLEPAVETMIATVRAPYLERPPEWPRPPSTDGPAMPFLRRVRCPALVIHGTADQIVPIEAARRLATTLRASLVEIADGGHAPNLRHPVVVNRAIRDFSLAVAGGTRPHPGDPFAAA